MPIPELQNKRIAVVTYTHKKEGKPSYLAGPSQDLKHYLLSRTQELFFVEQPISFSQDLTATAEWYVEGVLKKRYTFPMFPLLKSMKRPDIDSTPFGYLLFKIRDILSTLVFFARVPGKWDYLIAVESINAVSALFLRFIGKVRKVIFDVIDYSPLRFPNKCLNKIYHFLDNFCVKRCDASWNQTPLVREHRATKGVKKVAQYVKPTGVDSNKLGSLPWEQLKTNQMVYVGGIYPRDGVELLIESLPKIVQKIPKIKLLIIGYGILLDSVTRRSEELGVGNHIEFLGEVANPDKVDALIKESALGLAPYKDDPDSLKAYNDTAKPKLYLSFGLPVVMTQTTLFSKELQKEKAGFATPFEPDAWAEAVIEGMADESRLKGYRDQALKLAKKYQWDIIFDRLFLEMEN